MNVQPEQLLKQIKEGQMQIKAYQAIVDAKKELLEQAEDFDKFERQCTIQWIQKIKVLEVLETPIATEDVRG